MPMLDGHVSMLQGHINMDMETDTPTEMGMNTDKYMDTVIDMAIDTTDTDMSFYIDMDMDIGLIPK
jgi:hypothetical protein